MKAIKNLIIFFCMVCILESCSSQEIMQPSQGKEQSPQVPSVSVQTTKNENFSYGDEITFYRNDEKTSSYPSAISVVTKFLEFMKANDFNNWLSTMTLESQKGFSMNEKHELGVINLNILDVHYEADTRYKQEILKCEKAIKMGLTPDNIAVVYALYDVKYDHTKVSSDDGRIEWHITLIREDKNSPWYVQEWGYGYGGI